MDKSELQRSASTENNRARVRRVVFEPLRAKGFHAAKRPAKGMIDAASEAQALAEIADRLSYMSTDALRALADCMATKGAGSRKDFWPSPASFESFAEAIQPRPMEDAPALLRWFRSRAGPEALAQNRHVAEYLFWKQRKAPPINEAQKAVVRRNADDMASRAARLRERRGRDRVLTEDDASWLAWFDSLDRRVRDMITAGDEVNDAA